PACVAALVLVPVPRLPSSTLFPYTTLFRSPLYVGGGIRKVEHVGETLAAGATKVSITSAAISNPDLLKDAAKEYGKEKIILSIEDRKSTRLNSSHASTSYAVF